MKRQHVREIARLYRDSFDRYVATIISPPEQPTVFTFITDFRSLPMPLTCIAELRQTLLDRVPSCGAALSISVPLHQSIDGLANALSKQEASFAFLRSIPNEHDRISAYFGLRTSNGNIDERYPHLMSAIISFVDDGIYFPMLLCEVLTAHGHSLAKSYGRRSPKVSTITYRGVEDETDLLPDRANFPDFERSFRPSAPAPAGHKT